MAAVDPHSLLSGLDPHDAITKQIYLSDTLDDVVANWSYLPELFEEFRNFYVDAAQNGNGMMVRIT